MIDFSLFRGIRDDSQWLIGMVENLLTVTRIDNDGVKIVKTPTVLEELVDAELKQKEWQGFLPVSLKRRIRPSTIKKAVWELVCPCVLLSSKHMMVRLRWRTERPAVVCSDSA